MKYSVAFQHPPLPHPQLKVVYSFFMSLKGSSLNTSWEIIKDCHFEQLSVTLISDVLLSYNIPLL